MFRLKQVLPILCKVGSFKLHSYGLMLALGFVVAIARACRHSYKAGLSPSRMMDAGLLLIASGIVGGRLSYVLLHADQFQSLFDVVAVWDGGMTFHGGLLFGFLAGVAFVRIACVNAGRFADLVAPSLALGYGIARLGCFLNGCCYGCQTDLPWGVRLRADGGDSFTPPVHPVQIYSTILNIVIFILLVKLENRKLPQWTVFGSWLVLSGLERFFMEWFRAGSTAVVVWGGITQAQSVCLLLVLSGACVISYAYKQGRSVSYD